MFLLIIKKVISEIPMEDEKDEKVFEKNVICIILVMALAVSSSVSVGAKTTPAKKTVEKAYITYLKNAISKGVFDENLDYTLFDFNKDGVNEAVVSGDTGARACYYIYTYYNGKVTALSKYYFNDIGYIDGKKYIVTYGSGGYNNYNYTVYKITKGKLKKVEKYACVNGVFQKNGKEISRVDFNAFKKTVKFSLGDSKKIEKSYYSPKKLGISVYNTGKQKTCVEKATKSKVYYRTITIGDEGTTAAKSKLKSAKIISKTKFYYGDTTLLFSGTLPGKNMDTKKWIYTISKTQFLNKMKTYRGAADQIIVKNGKVEKVIIHIQVAG